MARADFCFAHRLRVRWAEVDRQGIVFNGHYLTYFDVGITEYWRAIGFPYPDAWIDHGNDTFVVKATLEYHAPAHFDDLLDVCVRIGRIGNSSMHLQIEIHRTAEAAQAGHLISGEVIYVNADPVTRRPKPVGQALRDAVARLQGGRGLSQPEAQ